jgi:hypothetical protein
MITGLAGGASARQNGWPNPDTNIMILTFRQKKMLRYMERKEQADAAALQPCCQPWRRKMPPRRKKVKRSERERNVAKKCSQRQ